MKTSFHTRLAATITLAGCAAGASAGLVSLSIDPASPLTVGSTVTFTVSDSNPRDMADPAGLVAGDFSLRYDSSLLRFLAITYPSWLTAASATFAIDNGTLPPDGEVLVTIAGADAAELPASGGDLFAVSFITGRAGNGEVAVAPAPGAPGGAPAYAFDRTVLPFAVNAVPLPATLPLVALGLLAAGVATRRPARPIPR